MIGMGNPTWKAVREAVLAGCKHTPDEWIAQTGIRILDPDGWDRRNFTEDWAKPLTFAEFERKAMASTADWSAWDGEV